MRRIFRRSQFKYVVAAAIVLGAAALRLIFLQSLGTRAPFLTFYPAVILAALYGGLRAGLLATLLSAVLADYFWLEPAGLFSIEHRADWLSLAGFLASATLISWITEAMHRARVRAAGAEDEARIAAERVQVAETLRAGEERLRFAQETSHTGAWDLDLLDHSAFRSLEHDRIFGYEELLPRWTYEMFLEHVLPEDREAVDAKFRHATATQGDWSFECRIRRADGEIRWISAAGRHHPDSKGGMRRMAGIVQDITERKQAEGARARLAAIVESSDDAIIAEDLHGTILSWNAGAQRMFGYPAEEVIGQSIRMLLPPDMEKEEEDRILQRLGRGERIEYLETVRVARDGRHIDVSIIFSPLRDQQGQIVGASKIICDITGIRKAQIALQESEQRLRMAQQAARIGSFEWNIRTNVNTWTPELEAMYGLQPGQFGGTEAAWEQLVHPEDREPMIRLVHRSFETGQPSEGEWRAQWADGSVHWIYGRFQLQKDETGKPLRLTGVNIDITERKRAEAELEQHRHHLEELVYQRTEELEAANAQLQAEVGDRKRAQEGLRESEIFYRQTLESIPGMVFTTRPDGFCDYQSQQWVDYTGIPMSEHLGDGWNKLLHPDDRPRAYAAWRDAVEGRATYDLEYRVRRHDGQYEWFKVIGRPIRDGEGQIVRWFGVAANIHDLKRAERQLKDLNETLERRVAERTDEAEQRARQLSELAVELTRAEQRERRRIAQVLHDHLQQLLVGARFSISVVRNKIAEPQLRESLQQVAGLLDESVRASRSLTAELSPPVLRQGTLADIMRWLIQWMRDRHDLEVHAKIDDHVDTQAEEIRALLFEASRELLFNVVKHAGVRQACLELARLDGGSVRVTIADRGRGFDPACLRTGQGSATGFGLFSIEERLRLLGGQIDIESRPGAGTRATVIAPLQPRVFRGTQEAAGTQAQLTPPTQLPPDRPGDIRVLLADDHQVVRDGLATMLQLTDGIQVVAQASDGQEALDLARQLQPDVVIMDVAMPRLDGIEATRQLHAEHPAISVIGLSMHVEPNVAQAMTAAGAATYLAKTAPPESLVAAVLATKHTSSSGSSR